MILPTIDNPLMRRVAADGRPTICPSTKSKGVVNIMANTFARRTACWQPPMGLPDALAAFYRVHDVVQDSTAASDLALWEPHRLAVSTLGHHPEVRALADGYPEHSAWYPCRCVQVATTMFHEPVLFLADPPEPCHPGVIAIIGGDVAGPKGSPAQPHWLLVAAGSMDEWVERLRRDGWREFAITPGDIAELPYLRQRELKERFASLNAPLLWS